MQHGTRNDPNLVFLNADRYNYVLYDIEKILNRNGRSLREFVGIPFANLSILVIEENSLLIDELH